MDYFNCFFLNIMNFFIIIVYAFIDKNIIKRKFQNFIYQIIK